MFQYSPRPGTRAANFDDQIPKEVVQERFDRLLSLQTSISQEASAAQLGSIVEVLVEGGDRKGRSTQSRTRTNRIVHLPEPLDPGTFVWAEVIDTAAHHLRGRVVPAPAAVFA
jgi:tRNA-2-methylthio-N6-dimethylallyladenosine synthase